MPDPIPLFPGAHSAGAFDPIIEPQLHVIGLGVQALDGLADLTQAADLGRVAAHSIPDLLRQISESLGRANDILALDRAIRP